MLSLAEARTSHRSRRSTGKFAKTSARRLAFDARAGNEKLLESRQTLDEFLSQEKRTEERRNDR
jgi:hypothetical protein